MSKEWKFRKKAHNLQYDEVCAKYEKLSIKENPRYFSKYNAYSIVLNPDPVFTK